jgi:hypothetical protein
MLNKKPIIDIRAVNIMERFADLTSEDGEPVKVGYFKRAISYHLEIRREGSIEWERVEVVEQDMEDNG